ncbi:sugar phosphate isomerase/epimerase [Paenibacillus frigoriresistens]|uniref:sugar phosphate isomerase/epimerase family protein n=1 Tax=Paenibacillus alginolyticus TaxID=59839 RepID=UPI0015653B25|nr:sugar phosphate isomerase/epimerase [Paenibacillus frigoriresistens]NRF90377.1 sugar phosphate isomerase/epimerase [Paenibacillus frigoriresistens]
MKLGVFMVLFSNREFEETLDYLVSHGIEAIEIGTGGYVGNAHCKPDELLQDAGRLKAFKRAVDSRNLTISALSCHGNPLHPQNDLASSFRLDFVKSVELAERLEVPTIVNFSGLPGDHEGARYPNWPVAPWPHDFQEVLQWQWDHKVIPYWTEMGKFAESHHVNIALEPHGGFSVHTPATLLKLRERVGEVIGANFDPSHMWWQGIDPVQAIQVLGRSGAIHHFHAKDTSIDPVNANRYGLTDMQPYSNIMNRAWQFRTVGYGHDLKVWADMISALRLVGYDGAISIEHEDGLMSKEEGFTKAVKNLQQVIIKDAVGEMWWV